MTLVRCAAVEQLGVVVAVRAAMLERRAQVGVRCVVETPDEGLFGRRAMARAGEGTP